MNSGQFKHGVRASPATEFKKGDPRDVLPIGAVTFHTDHATGEVRAWVKTARRKWRQRAVVVWEQANGPLPMGMIVHHKDRNTTNDAPDNLEAKTRAAHITEHRPEFEARRVHAMRDARAKVTEDDVRAIRERAGKGESWTTLAAAYGVAKTTIQGIVHRQTWRHL